MRKWRGITAAVRWRLMCLLAGRTSTRACVLCAGIAIELAAGTGTRSWFYERHHAGLFALVI